MWDHAQRNRAGHIAPEFSLCHSGGWYSAALAGGIRLLKPATRLSCTGCLDAGTRFLGKLVCPNRALQVLITDREALEC